MKYLKIIIIALLCMGVLSCEKRHVNDNLYDSSVYIINHGLQKETLYDVEGKTHTFTVNTYCAGFNGGEPNVRLVYNKAGILDQYNEENGTSYRLLPENCYKLDSRHKVMDDNKVAFVVTFDCDKIAALSNDANYDDIQDYVIPYTVVSESKGVTDSRVEEVGNIFIKPEMHLMSFRLVAPEMADIVEDAESYSIPFKLQTVVENKWDSGYNFDWVLTDGDGSALSPESYSITSSSETFVPGVSEITYELKLFKSSSLDVVNIKTTIAKDENGFEFIGKDVCNWKLEINAPLSKKQGAIPGFDRTRPATDVCNSFQYANRSGYALIDGSGSNRGEYWGWAWNASGAGWPGHANGHPYVLTFDLTSVIEIVKIDMWRSPASDGNWKALGKGYIEFSTNRETWGNKVEFDFTGSAYPFTGRDNNLGPLSVPNEQPVSCKYIRFTLTENWIGNGDKNAAFQEIDVYVRLSFGEVAE